MRKQDYALKYKEKMKKILCVVTRDSFQLDRLMSYLEREYVVEGLHVNFLCARTIFASVRKRFRGKATTGRILKYKHLKKDSLKIKDDKNLLSEIRSLNVDEVFIPLTLENVPIMFIPNEHIKDIRQLYDIIRFLRLCSIEKMYLFDIGSLTQLKMPHVLDEYVDIHRGRRAFVVGNGPSLANIDMSHLKDEITLGANRVYLGFEKWGFDFNYWGITDRLQIEEHFREWEKNIPEGAVKFFPFEYLPAFNFKNSCPINFIYKYNGDDKKIEFDRDPRSISIGFTVTHMLLQIAVIMGCNPIYLIGVDHNYNLQGVKKEDSSSKKTNGIKDKARDFFTKRNLIKVDSMSEHEKTMENYLKDNIWRASNTSSPTHFDKRYNDPATGRRFVTPKPELANKAFSDAKEWCDKNGIFVYNATPGSKLDVFERVDYDSLF